MAPARDGFKAGAFLQSQTSTGRHRNASEVAAWHKAPASFPKVVLEQGQGWGQSVPQLCTLYAVEGPLCLKLHHENWGLG
jgi:hypothetical protein